MSISSTLQGINAIPITPFDEQGQIDYKAMAANLDFLIASGIEVVYPCGNTSEFFSLSIEEAKQITEFSVKHVAGRAKVMIGIGYDAGTASQLAQHAEAAGADGLMIHQPVNPFLLPAGLIEYYKQIASSTKLPILLYVRHESVTLEVLKAAADVPNIIGVKYAVNHMPSFTKAVQQIGDRLLWICGTAETWAPYFFAAGAVGFTSGLVNVAPELSLQMLDLLKKGDYKEAMKLWVKIRPFEELREGKLNGNNVSVVKEAMKQLGLGNGIVRPPIAPLQEDEKEKVAEMLRSWGKL